MKVDKKTKREIRMERIIQERPEKRDLLTRLKMQKLADEMGQRYIEILLPEQKDYFDNTEE